MSQTAKNPRGNDNLLPSKLEKSALFQIKERLQFTGWLQFMPSGVLALACFVLALVGRLIGVVPGVLFWPPLVLGCVLASIFLFDLITVKFGVRPQESLPAAKNGLDAFDLMRARRSCRSFQARDLTAAHKEELMGVVARYSALEHQLGEKPIRLEYIAAPLTVWPVVGAHEFLVAIAPKPYDRTSVIDVGRSLQKIVMHAVKMGLGTCWIGPGADHQSIMAHLGERFDPETEHIICVCALGYESWFKPTMIRAMGSTIGNRRKPLSQLFFADPYFETPLDTKAAPFASYGRCYEVCQWAPSSFNSQTSRCAAVMKEIDGEETLIRFDFATATASRYYAPVAIGIWCANWELGCEALDQRGHFEILTPAQRDIPDAPELPRYDVSWIVETPQA